MSEIISRETEYYQARVFVSRILDGLPLKTAFKAAGFLTSVSMESLLDRSDIRQLLATMMRDRVQTLHAPKALKFLSDTLKDKEANGRLRLDCAKHLLGLAGFQAPKVLPVAPTDYGAPSEMSSAELQATIDRLQGEIGQRATGAQVIDAQPVEVDMFS